MATQGLIVGQYRMGSTKRAARKYGSPYGGAFRPAKKAVPPLPSS